MSDQITQSYRKVFSTSKGFLTNSVFYHENQDYTSHTWRTVETERK